jgi:hypothetical protein
MASPQTTDGLIPVKLYIKEIDGDNHGIFAVIRRDGNDFTEVQVYPPET